MLGYSVNTEYRQQYSLKKYGSEENIWNMSPIRKPSNEKKWVQEAPRNVLKNRGIFLKGRNSEG